MTNLKTINFGLNQFCGPAVMSALTGKSTDECAAVISAVSGRKEIKAVQPAHIKEALKRLRFDVSELDGGPTLFGVLNRLYRNNGFYVIFVPRHVVAIEIKIDEVYICDNHTKTPLNIRQSARLLQKVEAVWRVFPHPLPKFVGSSIRLDKHINHIDIVCINRYENSEDDTQYSLGSIRYEDQLELTDIIRTLTTEFDAGLLS
jgi:hypothetical protein